MNTPVKEKNVQIPISLFNRIVDLLDAIDTDNFDPILLLMYNIVQNGIRKKRVSMLHRETYAEVINANDKSEKRTALDNYINTKRLYENR